MDSFSAQVVDDLARIERLIEEILDYARYMKPKLSAESLNNIVASCLQFIEVKADKLGITIEKHLAEDLPTMLVDRQQIKQVIMNLAMNAIDAIDAMAKTGREFDGDDPPRGSSRQQWVGADRSGRYRLWNCA